MKLLASLSLGLVLGASVPVFASSPEGAAVDRVATILDKLLDAVKDGFRKEPRFECVCRCEK